MFNATQLDVETRAQQAQQAIVELARKVLSPTRMVVGQIKSVADVSSGFIQARIEDANTNVGIGPHTSGEITVGDYWLIAHDTYTNHHILIYKLTDSEGNPAPPTSLSLNKPSTITLNADETGTPTANWEIIWTRGTSDNIIIRGDESTDHIRILKGSTEGIALVPSGEVRVTGLFRSGVGLGIYTDPLTYTGLLGIIWATEAVPGVYPTFMRIDSEGRLELIADNGNEDIWIDGTLDFRSTMGNSSKNPTTDAPADWVEIKISGTTYYLPAYTA